MNEPRISLERWPYEDSAWRIYLRASDAGFAGAQEFYARPDQLEKWARQLIAFPGDLAQPSETRLELGGRTGNWAYYLLLRAFVHDRVGHAAIEVDIDTRVGVPGPSHVSFFIPCEAGAVNRLGEQVLAWIQKSEEPLSWTGRYV